MGCGQSKEIPTNQKPASELLTNQGAVEVTIKTTEDDDMKTANKIEMIEEEKEAVKEDNVDDDEGVEEISKEDPVVTVEAPQHKEAAEDIKGSAEVIKGTDIEDSTSQSTASDLLTNQKPEETLDKNDDPPPPYQTLSGKYYSDFLQKISKEPTQARALNLDLSTQIFKMLSLNTLLELSQLSVLEFRTLKVGPLGAKNTLSCYV